MWSVEELAKRNTLSDISALPNNGSGLVGVVDNCTDWQWTRMTSIRLTWSSVGRRGQRHDKSLVDTSCHQIPGEFATKPAACVHAKHKEVDSRSLVILAVRNSRHVAKDRR